MWKFITLFFLLAICRGNATEYQPWLGNVYEFEWRTSLMYQGYSWLSSGPHLKKYASDDLFLNISLSNSLPNFGLEIEATEARTRVQKGDIDQLKMTARYVWQDDVAGDPLSITTGLSFIQAFRSSVKDISSFHHGQEEGELFLSLGKESSQQFTWSSRWWSILGLGIANKGSPWIRFNLAYERRLWDTHELKLFLHSLWGLGHKRLYISHFHGYGSIQHQSVEMGLRYTHLLDYFGSASLEYSYCFYAHHFPIYAHRLCAQLFYTFGL